MSTATSVNVPIRTRIGNVPLTKEYSRLEPGQGEHKYCVRRIGNVRAVQVQGKPSEYLTGITFHAPGQGLRPPERAEGKVPTALPCA